MYRRELFSFKRIGVYWRLPVCELGLEVVHSSSDVNHMFESLYTKLSEIIDAHVPVKKISNNQLKLKSKPWITPAIKNSIQIKNKLYKNFLKTKSHITILNLNITETNLTIC